MKQVFLSYSRHNEATMRRVYDQLRAAGLDVWIDQTGIPPGSPSWQDAIQKAIEASSAIVVLLSPQAKKSSWVLEELRYAKLQNKKIYPILVDGDEGKSIPFGFSTAQWIDVRKLDPESMPFKEKISALSKQICDVLGIPYIPLMPPLPPSAAKPTTGQPNPTTEQPQGEDWQARLRDSLGGRDISEFGVPQPVTDPSFPPELRDYMTGLSQQPLKDDAPFQNTQKKESDSAAKDPSDKSRLPGSSSAQKPPSSSAFGSSRRIGSTPYSRSRFGVAPSDSSSSKSDESSGTSASSSRFSGSSNRPGGLPSSNTSSSSGRLPGSSSNRFGGTSSSNRPGGTSSGSTSSSSGRLPGSGSRFGATPTGDTSNTTGNTTGISRFGARPGDPKSEDNRDRKAAKSAEAKKPAKKPVRKVAADNLPGKGFVMVVPFVLPLVAQVAGVFPQQVTALGNMLTLLLAIAFVALWIFFSMTGNEYVDDWVGAVPFALGALAIFLIGNAMHWNQVPVNSWSYFMLGVIALLSTGTTIRTIMEELGPGTLASLTAIGLAAAGVLLLGFLGIAFFRDLYLDPVLPGWANFLLSLSSVSIGPLIILFIAAFVGGGLGAIEDRRVVYTATALWIAFLIWYFFAGWEVLQSAAFR